ncbi:DUF3618 domain-containing protein [Glycomyces tarimensis]
MRPGSIAKRGKERVQRRVNSAREKVMGSVDVDSEQMGEQIKGNPLAAGLIAFGAGALVASLLPGDRTSREAAQQLSERGRPVAERAKAEAKEAGQSIGENVGDSAKESARHLQEEARDRADDVKQEAQSSGERVKSESQRASENVRNDARG